MSSISPFLSQTAKSTPSAVAFRPLLPFLYPALANETSTKPNSHGRGYNRLSVQQQNSEGKRSLRMENVFITALVKAGSCNTRQRPYTAQQTGRGVWPSQSSHGKKAPVQYRRDLRRSYHDARAKMSSLAQSSRNEAQNEVAGLVDLYPLHEPATNDEEEDLFAEDRAPSEVLEMRERTTHDAVLEVRERTLEGDADVAPDDAADEDDEAPEWPDIILPKHWWFNSGTRTVEEEFASREHEAVDRLEKQLDTPEINHEAVFEAYQALPFPRVSYLSEPGVRKLLSRMSVIRHKDEAHVARYLSILDDTKVANIPATSNEWNTAIHMAGQTHGNVTAANLESSLYIWRDMEQRAGVRSTPQTFNILFEIAAKANRTPLVALIMQEMEARQMSKTRFYWFLALFYQGSVGNGNGTRKAYREFVAAGEIVDTSVLNAVIVSLYRCGEPAAAESTFKRMKLLQQSAHGRSNPPDNWWKQRRYWRWLEEQANLHRNDADARRALQDHAPIAPDGRTYRIMIEWAAEQMGDWQRVDELRREMREDGYEMTRYHYRILFRGFIIHGPGRSNRMTSWTQPRLEQLWGEFAEAMNKNSEEFLIDRHVAMDILRAFETTCGSEHLRRHWEVLKACWRDAPPEHVGLITSWVSERCPNDKWRATEDDEHSIVEDWGATEDDWGITNTAVDKVDP